MATSPSADLAAAPTEAPAAPALALDVRQLERRFGERSALLGVSLQLQPKQTLAVFGPNGAGKTTLLRVLATLLLPHSGSVRVLGKEIPREAHAVRKRIGFLGHEPLLYRELSGRENLTFYARLYGLGDALDRIGELLAATHMEARADDPVRDLSRGMVQRLAICRAVLHHPELLLLDEPTGSLDPGALDLVEPLIGASCGCTRVLVTHDIERGLAEAGRVLALSGGAPRLEGPAAGLTPHDIRLVYRDGPR